MTNRSLDLAAADLRVRRGSVPASTQLPKRSTPRSSSSVCPAAGGCTASER